MSAELEAYFTALTQVRRRIHETAIAGHVAALAELRLDDPEHWWITDRPVRAEWDRAWQKPALVPAGAP